MALATVTGCSTKKNRLINRMYHNTTSHYNGYFNAKETVKWSLYDFENGYQDDYSELLPLYKFPDKNQATELYPDMQRAIDKCSKVIDKHSMYIQRKERNRWIDDCFFLIGKSHFYKREFDKAAKQFDYLAKEYKKEPDIKYESLIWLARVAIEKENYDKADRILVKLSQDKELPDEFRGPYHVAHADLFLRQKNYQLAITELKEAIDHTKKKKIRARYMFILGQVYQETENDAEAMEMYKRVVKLNPSYEMTFYAKISQALAFDVNSGNYEEVRELLEKLAADEKNEDYLDQIYYALAEMELREGNLNEGLDFLRKSIANNSRNEKLKVKCYLRLGKEYYEIPRYIPAANYYDSAYMAMDSDYPNYDEIEQLSQSLTKVATDIKTYQEQDSLLELATMPTDELNDYLETLASEAEERMEAERQAEQLRLQEIQERRANQRDFSKKGNFYFSNQSALNFGRKDFKEIWGDRQLEDNWRRKSKRSNNLEDFLEELTEEEELERDSLLEANPAIDDPTNPDYYRKGLPLTTAAQSASHNMIILALYDAGVVFMDEIKDDWMAIEYFTLLVEKYDTCRFTPDAYYRMYKMYERDGNVQKAAECKLYILNNHPLSQYAKILINPNYFADLAAAKSAMEDAYEFAYQTFQEEQSRETLSLCNAGIEDFKETEMVPKFALLKALAVGKLRTRRALRVELQLVNETWPKTPEGIRAGEYLSLLGGPINTATEEAEQREAQKKEDVNVVYDFDPEIKHHFVLLIPNKQMKVSDAKTAISNFNRKSFREMELNIKSNFLDLNTQMVAVKGFEDNIEAMDYYRAFVNNKHDLLAINQAELTMFVISADNFGRFYQDKDAQQYLEFFREQYQP